MALGLLCSFSCYRATNGGRGFIQASQQVFLDLTDTGGVVPNAALCCSAANGERPFGFQRQPRAVQMMAGHPRVVTGFLNGKYRHSIPPFGGLKKCSFWGKRRSQCRSGTPEGKTYGR